MILQIYAPHVKALFRLYTYFVKYACVYPLNLCILPLPLKHFPKPVLIKMVGAGIFGPFTGGCLYNPAGTI